MKKILKLFLFVATFFIVLKGYIFFKISPSILTNPNMDIILQLNKMTKRHRSFDQWWNDGK